MDEVTNEIVSPEAESKYTSPPSLKWPRTDSPVTNKLSERRRFDFPAFLTFQKNNSPGVKNTLQRTEVEMCTADGGQTQAQKPHKQGQHAILNVTPFSKATLAETENMHRGLTKIGSITSERHLLHLGKDELPPFTDTDKLCSCPQNDAGGALEEAHTSKDTSTDTSSYSDCRWLGKSLKDEPPGGCCLPAGNDRQVQSNVSKIQALSSSDEEVRCQSDCTREDAPDDERFRNTWNQSAEVKASNQTENKLRFSGRIPLSKEGGSRSMSFSDYQDLNSFRSNPKEDACGDFAVNEGKLQICQEETVADNKREKKDANEDGIDKNLIPSVTDSTVELFCFGDISLARDVNVKFVTIQVDDFCGVKDEHGPGEIISKSQKEAVHHTTETPMHRGISKEPAEVDNDPGPFSVIDPAKWSNTDREPEKKQCISVSTTALGTSPAVNVSERETPDVEDMEVTGPVELKEQGQSEFFFLSLDHTKTQQDENFLWNSATAFATMETQDMISLDEKVDMDECLDKEIESSEKLQQHSKKRSVNTKILTEGEIIEYNYRLRTTKDEKSTEENKGREVIITEEDCKSDRQENSKIGVKTEEQSYTTETQVSLTECISEGTEHNIRETESTLSQVCQQEQGNEFRSFQNIAEMLMSESTVDLVGTSSTVSELVVPCQHDSNHSQNANNTTALNCNDRFSPAPSVFPLHDRVPRGFDTFEKIQLSPDDDDEAAGLGNNPLLTSLPQQLLKTSERELHQSMPRALSSGSPTEEEVGQEVVARFYFHIDQAPYECISNDSPCNEFPTSICEAGVIAPRWPEQLLNCDSTYHAPDQSNPQSTLSSVSTERDGPSDANVYPEFEMRKHFDRVLKELNLFFDIDRNYFATDSETSTPKQCHNTAKALDDDVSKCEENVNSPELGHGMSLDDADDGSRLGDPDDGPVVSCTSGSCDGEQEVPLGSHTIKETPAHTAEKNKERWAMEQQRKIWTPSFGSPLSFSRIIHRAQELPRRLEPLRTCTRPIRVGLSKRAKTKHLHHPHPYK